MLTLFLASCKDKVICPAFQSTYILDDSTRLAFYNPIMLLDKATRDQYLSEVAPGTGSGDSISALTLNPETTLGEYEALLPYFAHAESYLTTWNIKKTKFGIIKRDIFIVKNYKLRTAPMENVFGPPKEDTTSVDVGDFVAGDFADSTTTLLASAKPMKQEQQYLFDYRRDDKFNVEQFYYNKYFGKLLVNNKPPAPEPTEEEEPDTTKAKKKKGLKGLLKKKQTEEEIIESDEEEEIDY